MAGFRYWRPVLLLAIEVRGHFCGLAVKDWLGSIGGTELVAKDGCAALFHRNQLQEILQEVRQIPTKIRDFL